MDEKKEREQVKFEEAVRPLIKWLCKNRHPHTKVIVTPIGAEVVEGVLSAHIADYLLD